MAGRRYRLLEVLGKGGFGTVYRAELLATGGFAKQVALKVLHEDAAMPEEMAVRLRDEARILGFIRHRAVVGVDSLARFDRGWGVVMEYVDGVDALAIVEGGGAPVRCALELVEEVSSALDAAWHARSDAAAEPLNLVHRDIKPANVRVTATGEVKILDFGVARASFTEREAETRSVAFGSLRYMAPERFDGVDGPESDVFALGLLFIEVATGTATPEPPKNPKRHARFVDTVVERLRLRAAEEGVDHALGDALAALVTDLLAYDPEYRPTARDVERRCRELRARVPGPWLRDWAEGVVPGMLARRPRQLVDSETLLIERAGPVEMHAVETDTTALRASRSPGFKWPFVVAVVAAGALIAVGGVTAALLAIWRTEVPAPDLAPPAPLAAAPASDPAPPPDPAPSPAVEPAGAPASVIASEAPAAAAAPSPMRDPAPRRSAPSARPAADLAHVRFAGDARDALLDGAPGRFRDGDVPAGTYTVKAWFGGTQPTVAGSVSVSAGETVTITCNGAFQRCSR